MRNGMLFGLVCLFSVLLTGCSQSIELDDDDRVTKVIAGQSSSVLLAESGRIFVWGHNERGNLGLPPSRPIKNPQETTAIFDLKDDEEIVDYFLHSESALALSDAGRVFMIGSAVELAYLEDKTEALDVTPYLDLNEDEIVTSIETYYNHFVLLTSQHRVLTLGADENFDYQREAVDMTDQFDLEENEAIKNVVLSTFGSYAISNQGRLFGFRLNSANYSSPSWDRQLNVRPAPFEIVDITEILQFNEEENLIDVVVADKEYFLTSTGRLFSFNDDHEFVDITETIELLDSETISKMYGSRNTSFFITSENRLLVSGQYVFKDHESDMDAGEVSVFGTGVDLTDQVLLNEGETVVNIEIGYAHIFILTDQGNIVGMGSNWHNRVWRGSPGDYDEPTVIPMIGD